LAHHFLYPVERLHRHWFMYFLFSN